MQNKLTTTQITTSERREHLKKNCTRVLLELKSIASDNIHRQNPAMSLTVTYCFKIYFPQCDTAPSTAQRLGINYVGYVLHKLSKSVEQHFGG